MTRDLFFASRCKGLRRSPAEKTGPRHCGKRSRLQPGLAQIRFIEVARHRPPQEANAIRTPLRSTNSAKLRVDGQQYRGGDPGSEGRTMALHRQLYQGSEL